MVSFVKLLRTAARLVQTPQPFFTEVHAISILRAATACPAKTRSHDDSKVMLNMFIHCPHVSTVFENNANVVCRTVTSFIIDENLYDDLELEMLFRQLIRKASINKELPVALMISMVNRLNSTKKPLRGTTGHMFSPIEDRETTEKLLRLIVGRLPRDMVIPTTEGSAWSSTAKQLHKKKSMRVEKAELYFLISVLRSVSIMLREDSIVKYSGSGAKASVATQLPEDIVGPVIQCISSLPAIRDEDVVPSFDDWISILYLIGSSDARMHKVGKEVWLRKVHLFNVKATDVNRPVLFSIMLKLVASLRESMKLDALEMWLDTLSSPELIATANIGQMRMFLLELSIYYKSRGTTDTAKKALMTARQVLNALDTLIASEKDEINALECRLEHSFDFPFLKTPEELKTSFSRINKILLTSDSKRFTLRTVADFLRYALKVLGASVHDVANSACNMIEVARHLLATVPQLDQCDIASLGIVSITCTSLIRIQGANEKTVEDCNVWDVPNQKMRLFADEFIHHPTASQWSLVTTGALHMMELLGLTSEARYTTPVREAILGVLRHVASEAEEINPYVSQRCYDLVLRSLRFHVADAEVLSVASDAIKRATSTTVLRSMTWDHRRLMLDRSTLLYRELVPMLSTRKEVRRLAKQIIAIASTVTSDRADGTRRKLSRREAKAKRNCAGLMWTLAVRATVAPVPRALMDRHLASMLSFTRRHWVSEGIRVGEEVCDVDEAFSRELLEGLIPSLRRLFTLAFTQRAAFFINLRRNKLVISTACEVLWFNRAVLSPCLWYSAQNALTNLPSAMSGHCTPQQLNVVRIAMEHTLRNAQACGNRGTWHLRCPSAMWKTKSNDDNEVVLGPLELGCIFACAELIRDASLREYLITLLAEQIALVGEELVVLNGENNDSLSDAEILRVRYFKKVIATLRRGTVLYY